MPLTLAVSPWLMQLRECKSSFQCDLGGSTFLPKPPDNLCCYWKAPVDSRAGLPLGSRWALRLSLPPLPPQDGGGEFGDGRGDNSRPNEACINPVVTDRAARSVLQIFSVKQDVLIFVFWGSGRTSRPGCRCGTVSSGKAARAAAAPCHRRQWPECPRVGKSGERGFVTARFLTPARHPPAAGAPQPLPNPRGAFSGALRGSALPCAARSARGEGPSPASWCAMAPTLPQKSLPCPAEDRLGWLGGAVVCLQMTRPMRRQMVWPLCVSLMY